MRCNEETILTPTAVDMSIDLVDLVRFIGRPFVKRLAVCYRTVILSVCPVCDVGVLWPNSSMDQDKLGVEVGLGPGDIVLDRNPATPKERAQPVQFSACVCCVQRIGWIKMQLGTEVDLSPCHIVLDGDSPRNGHSSPPCPCLLMPNGRPSQLLFCTCRICYVACSVYVSRTQYYYGRPM